MSVHHMVKNTCMLNFIDDHMGMAWIYPLKKKSDAYTIFQQWKSLVENKAGERIMLFHTDNSREYMSNAFAEYLHNEGICHQTTAREWHG